MRKSIEIDGVVWTQLCRSIEVSARHGFRVEVDIEHDIALFRLDGKVYGVDNVCTHKREPEICNGAIEGDVVTCPVHFHMFNIKTGLREWRMENGELRIESVRGLKTYQVMEKNDYVWGRLED